MIRGWAALSLTITMALACGPPAAETPPLDCCYHRDWALNPDLPDHYDAPDDAREVVRSALEVHGLESADSAFERRVAAIAWRHAASPDFWLLIDEHADSYAAAATALAEAGLPTVFASAPLVNSRFERKKWVDCAEGPWNLPLDTPGSGIESCTLADGSRVELDALRLDPPMLDGKCAVRSCAPDARVGMASATPIALPLLASELEHAAGQPVPVRWVLEQHTDDEPAMLVAVHLLAVCHLARSRPELAAGVGWARHLAEGGYCSGVAAVDVDGLAGVELKTR